MQRTIILAIILQLPARALGTDCAAGYKQKTDVTGLTCSTKDTDAASCNSNCCEKDKKKCGGLAVTCGFDSYHTTDDAWKNKAATEKTKNTACCTKKAKCGSATSCPPGFKPTGSAVAAEMCSADSASCGAVDGKKGVCCEVDTTTCWGHKLNGGGVVCDAGKYWPSKPDDALKKKGMGGTGDPKFKKACCLAKPTCESTLYSCPAGNEKDDSKKTDDCTTDHASCAAGTTCCKKDVKVCGGLGTITCNAGEYYPGDAAKTDIDAWKNMAATNAKKKTDCCREVATCKVARCPSGYKKKAGAGVDKLSCKTDAASCVPATCCEKDKAKCGGLTGITCAYGFYDESKLFIIKSGDKKKDTAQKTVDDWNNKPATEANKNINCCTPKVGCTGSTTTPVAIATTTPAAVRRYSEHKVAVQEGSSDQPWGANMLWLGVGGLIGMSVLMAVQGLRSRIQADAREVDDMLLGTSSE